MWHLFAGVLAVFVAWSVGWTMGWKARIRAEQPGGDDAAWSRRTPADAGEKGTT